jgi:hypothetical protein
VRRNRTVVRCNMASRIYERLGKKKWLQEARPEAALCGIFGLDAGSGCYQHRCRSCPFARIEPRRPVLDHASSRALRQVPATCIWDRWCSRPHRFGRGLQADRGAFLLCANNRRPHCKSQRRTHSLSKQRCPENSQSSALEIVHCAFLLGVTAPRTVNV